MLYSKSSNIAGVRFVENATIVKMQMGKGGIGSWASRKYRGLAGVPGVARGKKIGKIKG